jgi:glycosyltransferase involved in cell wall biosynthesis
LKIAMVVNNEPTRDPRVRREARALAAAGHELVVVGVANPKIAPGPDDPGVRVLRARPFGDGARGPLAALRAHLRWYERMAPLVDAAVADGRPDVLHAHDLDTVAPASRCARRLGIPCVFDDHEASYVDKLPNYVPADLSGAKRFALRAMMRDLQRRGESLELGVRRGGLAGHITVSDALADRLVERFGGARSVVLRNVPEWRAVERTEALRRRLGAGPDDRLLIYHGTVTGGSGVDATIRALAILGPRVRFAVLGVVRDEAIYRRVAAEAGVADRVAFLPLVPVDEMFALVAGADAAMVPTEPNSVGNRLGIPNKLFESMLAGVPVVASDLPEVGAIVRRTGAGVVYEPTQPGDPATIAAAVRRLLDDDALRRGCAEAASQAARDEFNWERESRRLIALYERIGAAA